MTLVLQLTTYLREIFLCIDLICASVPLCLCLQALTLCCKPGGAQIEAATNEGEDANGMEGVQAAVDALGRCTL